MDNKNARPARLPGSLQLELLLYGLILIQFIAVADGLIQTVVHLPQPALHDPLKGIEHLHVAGRGSLGKRKKSGLMLSTAMDAAAPC